MKTSCYSYWRTFCKMWLTEIMETVPYYDTLLLVQFILYTLQTYWIITRGIQLEDMGVEQYCKDESNLELYHKRTDTIHIWFFCGWDAHGSGSIVKISAAYTITQILSKSTVWITCGKRNSSTVCIEYKSLMYLHFLLRVLSAEHIKEGTFKNLTCLHNFQLFTLKYMVPFIYIYV